MISAELKVDETRKALQRLASGLTARTVPNRQIAVQLNSWVFNNFRQEGTLGGKPWAPLKESTASRYVTKSKSAKTGARVRRGFHPILQVTGNLRQSFAGFSDNNTAGVGARASFGVDYAEVHEYGAPERNVPARQMLPTEAVALGYGIRIYTLFIETQASRAGLK